jgi:hypothetical protein
MSAPTGRAVLELWSGRTRIEFDSRQEAEAELKRRREGNYPNFNDLPPRSWEMQHWAKWGKWVVIGTPLSADDDRKRRESVGFQEPSPRKLWVRCLNTLKEIFAGE